MAIFTCATGRLPVGVRLFDAVEFDERIATCDLLYDLAFLW
jgi:aminoglycoside phosphotransferase family enzyme